MVGYYQLLMTILLLRYEIPETLKTYLTSFGLFTLDIGAIKTKFISDESYSQTIIERDIPVKNKHLYDLEYHSGSMANAYSSNILLLVFVMVLHFIHNKFYTKLLCSDYERVKDLVEEPKDLTIKDKLRVIIFKFFHYTFYLNAILESLLWLLIIIVNEVANLNTDSAFALISFSFSILCSLIIGFFLLYIISRIIFEDYGIEETSYFSALYRDIRYQVKKWRLYYLGFILRRLCLSMSLILITTYDFQWYFYLAIQLWANFLIIVQCPFQNVSDNIIMIISEVNLSFVTGSIFTMPSEGTIDEKTFNFDNHEKKGKSKFLIIFRNNDHIFSFAY